MLNFPVKVDSSIDEFKKLDDFTINVYTLENELVVPIKISSNVDNQYSNSYNEMQKYDIANEITIREKITELEKQINNPTNFINLLLYQGHFILIISMSRLVHQQILKHKSRLYICNRCLSHCQISNKILSSSKILYWEQSITGNYKFAGARINFGIYKSQS